MAFSIIEQLEEAEKMLDPEDVAKLFSVSRQSIYKQTQRKKDPMPCVRIGTTIRLDPKALSYWVRKQSPAFAAAEKENDKVGGRF